MAGGFFVSLFGVCIAVFPDRCIHSLCSRTLTGNPSKAYIRSNRRTVAVEMPTYSDSGSGSSSTNTSPELSCQGSGRPSFGRAKLVRFRHRAATEQIAAVGIGDGERIAALAILTQEPSFEVRTPDIIWVLRVCQRFGPGGRFAGAAAADAPTLPAAAAVRRRYSLPAKPRAAPSDEATPAVCWYPNWDEFASIPRSGPA